jgi:hypothetical protein
MARAPKLSRDASVFSREVRNPIVRSLSYRGAFERSFYDSAVPETGVFSSEKAMLYEFDREWLVDQPKPNLSVEIQKHAGNYEFLLDRQFWDHSDKRRLVFLLGGVGSGKSTLMRYYFNSFCPHHSQKKDAYISKLVVLFDFKRNAHERFEDDFYKLTAATIKSRLDAHPKFHVPDLDQINIKDNPEAWVRTVLQHLNYLISHPQGLDLSQLPFRYVVFVLDNLDQTAQDCQRRACLLVNSWIDPAWQLLIWRVYIPLWPRTLDRLQEYMGMPFNRNTYWQIPLGSVSAKRILSFKRDYILDGIYRAATPYVQVDDVDEPDDGETVDERVISNSNSRDYVNHTFTFLERTFLDWADRLTSGDLRKQAQIWDNIVSSRHSFRAWREFRRSKSRSLYVGLLPYDLVDAALTGKCGVFNTSDHPIANVYAPDGVCGNLVLGCHTLLLLRDLAAEVSDTRIRQLLLQIGHSLHDVEECLRFFFNKNLWHEAPGVHGHHWLVKHTASIEAYLELSMHPAYVENVALVSDVSDAIRSRIITTSAMVPSEFGQRVESTLAFIEQMRNDEADLRHKNESLSLLDERRRARQETAPPRRDRIELESIWVRAALRYRERLVALRKKGFPVGAGMKWTRVLEDPNNVLQVALDVSVHARGEAYCVIYK